MSQVGIQTSETPLCFNEKPSDPSRAFVYSLLGDGEPHITGVGSPINLDLSENRLELETETTDNNEIELLRKCDTPTPSVEADQQKRSSSSIQGEDNTNEHGKSSLEDCNVTGVNCDDNGDDIEKMLPDTEAHPVMADKIDISTCASNDEEVIPHTAVTSEEDVVSADEVMSDERSVEKADELSVSHSENNTIICDNIDTSNEVPMPEETNTSCGKDMETGETSCQVVFQVSPINSSTTEPNTESALPKTCHSNLETNSPIPPELPQKTEGSPAQPSSPDISINNDEPTEQQTSSTCSLEVLQIQIPKDSLSSMESFNSGDPNFVDTTLSPDVVLTTHNTSLDSSEAYVTATNSENYDSAQSASEELCVPGCDEEQGSWSPVPDMQPDSLETLPTHFSSDRSLPFFVLEEGSPPSLSMRTPKKLFRDDEDQTPDVNLKDLEERNLREMERERRRIIDNQTVRRKKIDYWAFVSEDRQQAPVDVAPPVAPCPDSSMTPPASPGTQSSITTESVVMSSAEESSVCLTPPEEQNRACLTPLEEQNRACLTPPEEQNGACLTPPEEQNRACLTPPQEQDKTGLSPPEEQNRACLTPPEEHNQIPQEEHSSPPDELKSVYLAPPEEENRDSLTPPASLITPPASPVTPSRIPVLVFGRVSPGSLPKGWSSSPSVIRSVSPPVSNLPRMVFRARTQPATTISNPTSPVPPVIPEDLTRSLDELPVAGCDEVQAVPKPVVLATRSVSSPLPGSVDCASILENKERLRLFWERRIMAEQENVAASSSEPSTTTDGSEVMESSPPDSLNEEPGHIEESQPVEDGTINTPVKVPEEEESALDREVRISLEREQQLKQEQADRQQDAAREVEVDSVTQPVLKSDTEKVHLVSKPEDVAVPEDKDTKNLLVEKETTSNTETIVTETKEASSVEAILTEIKESSNTGVFNTESANIDTFDIEARNLPPSNNEPKHESAQPKVTSDDAKTPGTPVSKTDEDPSIVKPHIVGETFHLANGSSEEANSPALSPSQSPSVRPAALPAPIGDRPLFNPGADSKIAREIQEMKAREEELKKMRENLQQQQQNGLKLPNGSSRLSENGSVHSDDGLLGSGGRTSPPPPLIEEKTNGILNGQHGLDNLQDQTVYNVGYAFGHRRKDGIKVRPLSDEHDGEAVKTLEGIEKSAFPVLKESPIEREIRLAHEREEELRKEKGLVQSPVIECDTSNKRPSSLHLNGGRSVRNLVNGTKVVAAKDTQRFLATNRIQQEIVEQTEREMALRASGKIQTISQERTDAKVTRLRDVTSETRALQLSSSPPASPALSSSASDSDKSGPGTNGISNGHHLNGSAKTPSPSNSTVSGGQIKVSNGSAGRRFSNPPPVRGVSMQRFIASKGRELSFTAFNKNKENSNSVLSLHSEPFKSPKEGTRPLVAPVGQVNGKRCVPAETKIQEELKEMQAREDELRQQRARLLGLSQPNLSTLSGDEDLHVNNGHFTEIRRNGKGPEGLDRASSNPNLLDEEQYDDEDEKISVGGPRRRSMLIDQWEKRIQKSEVVKA